MFDWNDLKTFLAVAREGSILAAAKALRINQTTVARRMETLENDVGLKLFERGQTGSRLTEAGQDLVADAEKLEQAAAGFAHRAAGHRRGMAGALRVTASEILANLAITPSLPAFRALYPDIKVELVISDLPLDLEAGEVDVAVRSGDALTETNLVARKLVEFHTALYASRDYVLRRGWPRSPADLRGHDLIVADAAGFVLPGMDWMLQQAPGVEPAARCNSMTGLLMALKAGVGIAPFGCLAADLDPDLVRCLPPIAGVRPSVWLVTRADMKDVPRVRAFSDFIAPFFATLRRDMERRGEAQQARTAAEIATLLAEAKS